MKKNIFIGIATSLLLSTNIFAANDTATDLDLKSEIQILKQELKLLKEHVNANEEVSDELLNSLANTNDDLSDIDERIDDVESVALSDKIKFGLTMNQDIDYVSYHFTNGDTKSGVEAYSRVRLNMKSNFAKNMAFYGRLSMVKDWGNGYYVPSNTGSDATDGRTSGSSTLYMERAYLQWDLMQDSNLPMIWIIGRLPSSDGPSIQFKENTTRKSMNSALTFDGAADGSFLILKTDHYLKLHNSNIRLEYAKFIQDNQLENPALSSMSFDDTHILGVFFSTDLGPDTHSRFDISYIQAIDIQNSFGENTGDVSIVTSYLEFPNLYKSGLSAFIHGALTTTKPSGKNMFGEGLLGASYGDTEIKHGWALWAGLRYKFDKSEWNNPRVGIEYNHGSQNFVSYIPGANDHSKKLSTRGDVFEAYYTQPINRNAFIRFSAQYQDVKYDNKSFDIFADNSEVGTAGNSIDKEIYTGFSIGVKF